MKITLVQPKAGKYNPSYVHEPLNLGYLASYIKQKGFNDINIVVSAFWEDDSMIVDLCAKSDVVGFTATSPMMNHALFLAKQIKTKNSDSIVVFGGTHSTVEPDETIRNSVVDYVVRGEGEQTFFELLKFISENKTRPKIYGLSLKDDNGDAIHNSRRNFINDLDILPFPDRDLIDQERFLENGYTKYGDRGAWILSSRGCPHRCTYCASNRVWTRKWRARSPENIIKEIQQLKNDYDVDRINFADDTFTVSRERLIALCQKMIAEKLSIAWACNARVDTVSADIFKLMRRAGCSEVWMGVESGSPEILKEIKKNITIKQIIEAFKSAEKAGLKRRGYFMIGSRSESFQTIKETESLVDNITPDSLAFSILTPYPGCEEFEIWKKGQANNGIEWSEIDLFDTDAVMIDTRFLSKEELKAEHQRLKKKYNSIWRV
jgi:anaerobic magnesium-protoporphyrin IX monomethyl ester cyclase